MSRPQIYVGLMSGTSLDGVDAALVEFPSGFPRVLASTSDPFEAPFRAELLSLCSPGPDEIDRAARLGAELARRYARAVLRTLETGGVAADRVRAIGCHGQTVRHRPDRGYSLQIGNAALLAELTGVAVVSDFRSRDIAAGGQGAPLAPAFHAAVFGSPRESRAVLNLGGMANLTWLPQGGGDAVLGFDCGPGNCLLDLWAARNLGKPYDADGVWGRGGRVDPGLLARLLHEPYFSLAPPKSTGRELFGEAWLMQRIGEAADAQSVQATLTELTATVAARAIQRFLGRLDRVIVCGGGARNPALLERLRTLLSPTGVETSTEHGLDAQLVESVAFAWLAKQAIEGRAAGMPSVTGARAARVLGAIYPK